jgi:sugar lactone lactonase YvrE
MSRFPKLILVAFFSWSAFLFAQPARCEEAAPPLGTAATSSTRLPDKGSPDEPVSHKAHTLEVVAECYDQMPRGVAVTNDNRIFLCFPKHDDKSPYTLAELVGKTFVPYPNEATNKLDTEDPKNHFISVMSAVVDNKKRLWLLDSGRLNRQLVKGGPKLVAVDLSSGQIVKNISFPDNVVLPKTILTDLEIDPVIGHDGTAIIADSAPEGESAFIVVDLATGKSMRRLNKHRSVMADFAYVIFAEGRMVRIRTSETDKRDWTPGLSGLALSPNGKELYYSPLASSELYQVSTDKLCDPTFRDADIEKTVKSLGQVMGTSDGLECDSQNRIYLTDVQFSSIWRRNTDGKLEKLVRDPRLVWPERLCLAHDGYLYVIASQLNRAPLFHYGQDLRTKPYQVFRIKVNAQPVQPSTKATSKAPVSSK